MMVRTDKPLTVVEEEVRMMLQCFKSYNQLHLHLKDGEGREWDFVGDYTLEEVGCTGEEVTVVCTARNTRHEAWACYRPEGALLQAAREDRVALTVKFQPGDFSKELPIQPWRTMWGMGTSMQGLEAFLRAQLVLKDPNETMMMLVKDDEGRGSYFFSCLTPRELRLTTHSYIYCVGLSREGTFDSKLKLSWAGWRREAKARFGEVAAARLWEGRRRGEVEVRVTWAPLVASRLPGYQQGEVLLTCPPAAPLLQVEAFLRSQLWPVESRHRLSLSLTTTSASSTEFYGLQTAEELGVTALLVHVSARPTRLAYWAALQAAGRRMFGTTKFLRYWRWMVLDHQSEHLGKVERAGEGPLTYLMIWKGDSSVEGLEEGREDLWWIYVSPSWHTVR